MAEPSKELFSDLGLSFLAHPITGNVNRKINRQAVKQSVKSLILTNFYERPFKPRIGCNLRRYLFEQFTPVIRQQIESAIRETISNYEPRADIILVGVEPYDDDNLLTISVAFMIHNDPEPVVLDVLLERVR